jgi:Asp-tRNA(Asn)/Glu-tRNA(Gln) amidotransferase A subunit family amidase
MMNGPAAPSATELARLIRKKEVYVSEVVPAHLRQIETVNPRLNAVVALAAQSALAEARKETSTNF